LPARQGSVDGAVRSDLARDRERRVGDIGHDDFGRAAEARHQDHQRADRAATGHQDALSEQRACLHSGMKANRERFGHRGFAKREGIGDR
jgi:hypothetical protein